MRSAAQSSGRRPAEEGEVNDRVNANAFTIRDETRSDTQIFEDAASYRIWDDDDNSVDNIQAEMREYSRMQHFIHATTSG